MKTMGIRITDNMMGRKIMVKKIVPVEVQEDLARSALCLLSRVPTLFFLG
jgi:hypothetical protein